MGEWGNGGHSLRLRTAGGRPRYGRVNVLVCSDGRVRWRWAWIRRPGEGEKGVIENGYLVGLNVLYFAIGLAIVLGPVAILCALVWGARWRIRLWWQRRVASVTWLWARRETRLERRLRKSGEPVEPF